MTTHPHKPIWQRCETWLIALAVLVALLFIVPHRARGAELVAPQSIALSSSPADVPLDELPFGPVDVADYFSTVLEMSAERAADGVIRFENLHASYPEDRWFITIRREGREVIVEVRAGGDYGMNLAREFFECTLFERAESEAFYAMLNDAQNAPTRKFPRFTLQMQMSQTSDLFTLTLRFSPPAAA